jgi:4-aminobutyrate aminotransferase/(S)-3-amino-2-methylpropionate transaminase
MATTTPTPEQHISLPSIKTAIPGPQSLALEAERHEYVANGLYSYHHIVPLRGEGAMLEDVDGNHFLDFAGGIGAMNVGHSHPAVVAAIQRQAAHFTHTCAHVAMPDVYITLAKRLAEITPGSFAKKVFFANSGAEGVENAIKIARYATGRPTVISFENSFHGRTLLTMSLTGKARPYRAGFGPLAPEIVRLPYPYPYRTQGDARTYALDALERAFATQAEPERVAAIVIEPVQGEGGFVVPPEGFLSDLRGITAAHGIVLIADEVQTGFGRTGKMWACNWEGLEPDLLVSAKSLGAGLPLAAVIGKTEIMDAVHPGGLGGTYGGNPVACAAALAVLEVFEQENLVEKGAELGWTATQRMQAWQERFPIIGEVRGLGAMVAMELVRDRATKEPASTETSAILNRCRDKGLLLIKAGLYDNIIRLLMPLVTTQEQLNAGLDILEAALAEA